MFSRRRKSSILGLSVLDRNLSSLKTADQPLDISEDIVGPLGLNLLYTPPVPLLELIFVHGLGGGSRKTWSKTSNPYHFWPKDWLPRDPEFKHVRIHAFGYNSDWGDRKGSVLNIHDFGKSLLAEILNSPEIGKNGSTPIIFIGHSMGGLVIKKTYLLASQDPSAKSLADRVYGMVFLATPHRGADAATILNNILRASIIYGQKPFVSDLEENSHAIQSINDEFRHYSRTLELRSFYETVKTTIGVSSLLIVSKDSATLGYPNEQSALLNATHRSICKFDSPSDPNFISIKNVLVTMTRDITQRVVAIERDRHHDQLRELQIYLGVSEIPEDDLTSLEDTQLEGSCQWFTWKKQFQAWRDSHPDALPHYWLGAQPAAGKSVMAAHVIRNLKDMNADCSYYFFNHNDVAKASLSVCLRSLAYQMALADLRIRQRLLDMRNDDVRFDKENELAVWRKVFLSGIFEVSSDRPHFWVIDALDESSSQNSVVSLLNKVREGFPLRVFMTSRPTIDIVGSTSQLEDLIYADEMTADDTRGDIELYLRANLKNIPLQDETSCQKVIEVILAKSRGCFLWVVLVLKEMRSAFSETDIQQVLEEIPESMEPFYERTLKLMSQTRRGKHLIKTVLLWTLCAIRPLTIKELEHALKLDTGETVLDLQTFIASTCGHLIVVDKSGRVSLIHETVRAFLLGQDLKSEFAVDKHNGHGRIADVALQYLSSDEMKPPRSQKLIHMYNAKVAKRSPFVDYACLYFSQHLRRSHSEDTQRFIGLCSFLKGNVCSWVEHIARTGNLQCLIRTAKDLKGFLQARSKYNSPMGQDMQHVDSWESDFIRLAAQFGRKLIEYPSAIFWLIPPFCPPMTAIGTQFGSTPHGIIIRGLSSMVWSDRISCIYYRDKQTRALACAETTFAVGLSDKSIKLYSLLTCQEILQLNSSQPAKALTFSNFGKRIAVSSVHFVTIFNVDTGERLWQTRLPQECLTLMFADQDKILWLMTKGGILSSLSVTDGSMFSLLTLNDPSDEHNDAGFRRIFTCAAFSLELKMVAALQRGQSIGLYDMEEGTFLGFCDRGSYSEPERTDFALSWIRDFVFNPNPASSSLAALYHDGTLVLFDPCELAVKNYVQADAQILACSPDGRMLATGDETGSIQIFEFESLDLVYKVIASDHAIRSLAFSSDGLQFLDIRGSQCNVWKPPTLVHVDSGETDSISDVVAEPTITSLSSFENMVEITALVCHPSGEHIFCGEDNGAVTLYSTATGKEIQVLYKHAQGIAINLLSYGSRLNVLVSADASSRFMVWKIVKKGDILAPEGLLLDARIKDYSIRQLLLDSDNERLLVSTIASDTIYDINNGAHHTTLLQENSSSKWVNHPRDPSKLVHFSAETAHIYMWDDLSEPLLPVGMKLASSMRADMCVKDVAACSDGCMLFVELSKPHDQHSASLVQITSASSFEEPFPENIESPPQFINISPNIEHIIGSFGERLLFLDRRMWVCSLDLKAVKSEYCRHFFIPDEWLSANRDLILKVTSKGDLVSVRKNEIAVIKRGLDNKQVITVGTS